MDNDTEHLTVWGSEAISRILAAMPNRKAKFTAMRGFLDNLYRPDEDKEWQPSSEQNNEETPEGELTMAESIDLDHVRLFDNTVEILDRYTSKKE